MQWTLLIRNNKPTMKMETKEINENFSHSISTVGYTFMKMNFGQNGKEIRFTPHVATLGGLVLLKNLIMFEYNPLGGQGGTVKIQSSTGGLYFLSFANRSSSFLLPSFSNSTVAVVFGGCPSIDLILPLPNLSCSTVSPCGNSDESLPTNGETEVEESVFRDLFKPVILCVGERFLTNR